MKLGGEGWQGAVREKEAQLSPSSLLALKKQNYAIHDLNSSTVNCVGNS